MTDSTAIRITGGHNIAAQDLTRIAALPPMICMILPLTQIAGVVYLYDLAMIFAIWRLGFQPAHLPGQATYMSIWTLFSIALTLAWLSALVRTGVFVRPTIYMVQYVLIMLYSHAFHSNVLAGRINLRRFGLLVVWAGVALSAIGILQFMLFQISPTLATVVYKTYLNLSGFDPRFFETRYLAAIENTGVVRVVGTWDVTTTYAGMLVLAAGWLLIARPHLRKTMLLFAVFGVAVLMTGARHGWVIAILLFFGLAGGNIFRRVFLLGSFGIVLAVIVMFLNAQRSEDTVALSFIDQLTNRYERTVEQGVEDSSIQLRYVDGTKRFLNYAAIDPSMLLVGVGIGTDKSLFEVMPRVDYLQKLEETHSWGFVSNSWLLIWRNWGILAFTGLVLLFHHVWSLKGSGATFGLLATALIFFADNYAAHVARCFFLLFLFLTALSAQGILERARRGARRRLE